MTASESTLERFEPVDTFKEAAPHLRRPFTPAAVKFRVLEGKQGDDPAKTRAMCAAYIDARLVGERLNMVIPHKWVHRFEPVQGGMMCHLQVDGLTRADVGHSSGTNTDMGLKGLYSDALKRAAVHFGVGVSLYAIPGLTLYARDGHIRVWKKDAQSTPKFYLQPSGEVELRNRYKRWLEQVGEQAFGKPLDHGDVEAEHEPDHPPEAPPSPTQKAQPAVSDVPAPDLWYVGTAARMRALNMRGTQIRAMLEEIGAPAPRHVSSWRTVLVGLSRTKRGMVDVWLLERESAGTPLATEPVA